MQCGTAVQCHYLCLQEERDRQGKRRARARARWPRGHDGGGEQKNICFPVASSRRLKLNRQQSPLEDRQRISLFSSVRFAPASNLFCLNLTVFLTDTQSMLKI